MRIRLQKGKQRELILLAKNSLPWKNFSEKLNFNPSYLSQDLKNERRLISEECYNKLCKNCNKNFDRFIIEKLNNSWGQIKGGEISTGTTVTLKIPVFDEKLAEMVGVVLGDGHVHTYKKGKKVRVYCIRIAGDSKKDKEYHVNYLKPLCQSIFNLKVKERVLSNKNGRYLDMYSKELVIFFNKMGIPSGNKIINQSTIPLWIKENKEYLKSCLRGLIDTDGSIFRMSNRDKNLLRISFTNHNMTLLTDTRNSFIKLGYNPSKIMRKHHFFISRQDEIKKYLKEVGFANKRHITRLKKFRESPLV